jgi:phosphohistidine phosphatase
MKTLYLIRHAKSSWDDITLPDFDRPLNERGKKNAPFMGKVLNTLGIQPDLIVSSNAKRAITTAKKIAEEVGYDKSKIKEEPKIYEASVKTLLQIVNQLDDKHKVVFMFGHNPGFTDFANYLSDANLVNIPTCGIARIDFDTKHWAEVSKSTGHLSYFDFPKNHL